MRSENNDSENVLVAMVQNSLFELTQGTVVFFTMSKIFCFWLV